MNCFEYATGKKYDCPENYCKPNLNFCPGLVQSLLNEGFKQINCEAKCDSNEHKIMPFVSPGRDFHFYVERNGVWSHKFRNKNPTNLDGNGNIIQNPLFADHHHHVNYSTSCGCFCIKNVH